MPLNPPSYIGHDVWYSPDVYVNQVQVALWQPPQQRLAAPQTLIMLNASVNAEDVQFQTNSASANNQGAAITQRLVQNGTITQEEADRMKNASANGSEASTSAGNRNTKIISNDTAGAENQTAFPINYQMSRNFTLGQMVNAAYGNADHWFANEKIGTTGTGGLTPGQLVANGRLLATNCLDTIKDHFPDMAVMSTIRPWNGFSQHGRFQACDFTRSQAGFKSNYDTAVWILGSDIPYDQLILEYGFGGSWVHVSYANPPTKSGASKVLTAKIVGNSTQVLATGKIVNMDGQLLTRNN